MNTNWNAYRMFFYVASCGTTSAAATKLRIAQPAVSHGIKQLEESFGCRLFERSSRGMELTAMGQLLFDNICEAVSAIENAERLVEAEVRSSHAVINIGASDVVLQYFLIPYLEEYKELNPNIEFNILHGKNTEEMSALFADNRIDFAVLHDAIENVEGFESIPVKEIHDVLFCSAKFADKIPHTPLTPRDLEGYPLVTHDKGCVLRKLADNYMKENGANLVPAYEYSLNSSIVQHVKRKFSLGIMYPDVIEDDIEAGRVVSLELVPPLPPRYFYLIKPQKMLRKAAKKFVSYILDSGYSHFE